MRLIDNNHVFGLADDHIIWLSQDIGVHRDMADSFSAMQKSALKDNIEITIASGFRSFERQLAIWNNKVAGKRIVNDINSQPVQLDALTNYQRIQAILLYSALPGASRHHWGTDIDVYDINALAPNQNLQLEAWEYQQQGPFYQLSQWLTKYAQDFGFYFPYQKYQGGVAAEPWHLSYQPLASKFEECFDINALHDILQTKEILLKSDIISNLDSIAEKFIFNLCPFKSL